MEAKPGSLIHAHGPVWIHSCLSVTPLKCKESIDMRTSEDVRDSGLYVSECCGEELVFIKGDTLWRCPRCQHLCEWELLKSAVSPRELQN